MLVRRTREFAFCVFIAALFKGGECAEKVTQPAHVQAVEGKEVKILCSHSEASRGIQWYKQVANEGPKFLIQKHDGKERQGRFTLEVDRKAMTANLTIRDVTITDTASIYCCAVERAGAGFSKLTFGSGTSLCAEPNIQKNPPSVYILQPKDSRSDISPVCLVTDFAPRQIDVSINEHRLNESDASVLINDKSYGVVGYLKRTEGKFSCIATNELKSVPGKPDTTPGDQCVNMDDIFETDEKLNFMSLATLGLRIIFLKSIIFNVLMTVHAMSS